MSYNRDFKVFESPDGTIIEPFNQKLYQDQNINKYYLKFSFDNDAYESVRGSFTPENEFSKTHINNLEVFYNSRPFVNTIDTVKNPFEKVFKRFYPFIEPSTLVHIDHIDHIYDLFVMVSEATVDAFPLLFQESSILEISPTPEVWASFLYYSVAGRTLKFPELRIYEHFDVPGYLATL